jgi:hypothetical protein
MTSAPKALSASIFSFDCLSVVVKTALYPLTTAAMASPMPVLPDVPSTIVPPGFSNPGPLGLLDHLDGHAVLDRVAGIERLELGDDGRLHEPRGDRVDADHRGWAGDSVEDRGADAHGGVRFSV